MGIRLSCRNHLTALWGRGQDRVVQQEQRRDNAYLWGKSKRMRGASTICWAMCGSGATTGMILTQHKQRQTLLEQRQARTAFYVVAVGTATPTSCGRRGVTTTRRRTATTTSVSVLSVGFGVMVRDHFPNSLSQRALREAWVLWGEGSRSMREHRVCLSFLCAAKLCERPRGEGRRRREGREVMMLVCCGGLLLME